jgi:Nitrogen permease regulator 2
VSALPLRPARRYRSPRHRPKPADKCPLLCCYYAEFDNQVGPKVCYQTPPGFMESYPMDMGLSQMEEILATTVADLLSRETNANQEINIDDDEGGASESDAQPRRAGESGAAPPTLPSPPLSAGDDASIFASCSDFIITGSELTGNILNLSTHQIHVLSRPTLISDERYERNALLFSAGFVLRRTEDPRPFRAVLNQLSSSLADAEHETQFLSRPDTRPHVLRVLEQLLLDLNSPSWECHLHLDPANVVNLKLFHPPKVPTKPVPEYAVPILLRRDRHVQQYDWDLAINWVSLHVDGVLNSRQIAKVAEVDLDMVLQCLRVLRHHSVIALVDMFFFTNHYESTERAAEMLAGRHPDLLQAAVQFCTRGTGSGQEGGGGGGSAGGVGSRRISHPGGTDWSPSLLSNNSDQHYLRSGAGAGIIAPEMASSPGGGGGSASYDERHGGGFLHVSPRYHRSSLDSNAAIAEFSSSPGTARPPLLRPEEETALKLALAELYCACRADVSVGDLWVQLLSSSAHTTSNTKRWRRAFQRIDHRRFTSFGLVHGLLRRMHCYPMVLDSTFDEEERDLLTAATPEEEAIGASSEFPSLSRERSIRSTSAGSHSRHQQQTPALRQQPANQQSIRKKALQVAHLMDGARCDDEIVSVIGRPLEELLEMVHDRSVTCTYAPGTHY